MIHAVSSFTRDLSVGTRLFLLVAFGAATIGAAAVVFAVADMRTQAAMERRDTLARALDLTYEVEVGLAQLCASGSAFMARGGRDAAEAYVRHSSRQLANLATLGNLPEAAPVRRHVDTLRDGIADHAGEFKKIAALEGAGPPARLAALNAATEEARRALEDRLALPGREALAGPLLALDFHVRRVLAGDQRAAVEMVRARHEGFDRGLAQADLGEASTTEIAERMNDYLSAVLDEAAEAGRQRQAMARMEEILDYLRPSLAALVAFRDEADVAITETVRERDAARLLMYGGAAAAGAVFLLIGSLMAFGISRPLRGLALAGRQLSDGHRNAFIPISTAGDELGDLARALRAVRDDAAETEARLKVREQYEKSILLQGQATHKVLLDKIETEIRDAAADIATAAAEIGRLADTAGRTAEDTGRHAADIAAASGETTGSLRKLAAVASELHASVADTHRRLAVLAPASESEAVPAVDAAEVGQHVAHIGRLALRTRLMALNSVIGTARSGDGAPEVEVISAEIGALTRQIAEESTVLETLGSAIEAARAPFDGLVETVDGQGAATRDILRNAEGAVAAVLTLSNAIARITRAAGETERLAEAMRTTADQAALRSDRLLSDVDGLLARLRR